MINTTPENRSTITPLKLNGETVSSISDKTKLDYNTETQVMYFGNLHAAFKYNSIEEEFEERHAGEIKKEQWKAKPRKKETIIDQKIQTIANKHQTKDGLRFKNISVKNSVLDLKQFSDNYLNDIVFAHFHIGGEYEGENVADKKKREEVIAKLNTFSQYFDFSEKPLGYGLLKCYAPIELTIFRNGMFSLTFHLASNVVPQPENGRPAQINHAEYLAEIGRVDYLRENCEEECSNCEKRYDCEIRPGAFLRKIKGVFSNRIIDAILSLINSLNLETRTISGDKKVRVEKHVTFQYTPPNNEPDKEKKNSTKPQVAIEIFRPYVGTYHMAKKYVDMRTRDRVKVDDYYEFMQNFAIAAARTTPEFLTDFDDPDAYFKEGRPTRDIFYYRDDIVYLTQRGWACVRFLEESEIAEIGECAKLKDWVGVERKKYEKLRIYRLEVIENILIVIQVIQSGVILARNLQRELNNSGRKLMIDMLDYRNKNIFKRFYERIKNGDPLKKYIRFLHRLRIHSTSNDIYLNLPAFVKSLTARLAVQRLIRLTSFSETVENTRKSFENYNAFFVKFSQQTQQSSLSWVKVSLVAVIVLGTLQLFNINISCSDLVDLFTGLWHRIKCFLIG